MKKIYCDICEKEQLYESWVEPLNIVIFFYGNSHVLTDYREVCTRCRETVYDSIIKTIREIKND